MEVGQVSRSVVGGPEGEIHRVDPDFGSILTVSSRDSQSNCWINLKIMGQPCEFQVRTIGKSRRAGEAHVDAVYVDPVGVVRLAHLVVRWRRLGVDVKVILMQPCRLCIENH